jgi:hypothetical protein
MNMNRYLANGTASGCPRLLKVFLVTTGLSLIAATGFAQNGPGIDRTLVQNAAEGGNGPSLAANVLLECPQ